jgi:hypothetical protein
MAQDTAEKLITLLDIDKEDVVKMTDVTNACIEAYVHAYDPQKYDKNRKAFSELVITGPAMVTATMIDKIAGIFDINRDDIKRDFLKKLDLAFRLVDHKNKTKN